LQAATRNQQQQQQQLGSEASQKEGEGVTSQGVDTIKSDKEAAVESLLMMSTGTHYKGTKMQRRN